MLGFPPYPHEKVERSFREKITVVRGKKGRKEEKEEKHYSVFFLSFSESLHCSRGRDEPLETLEVLLASELEEEDVTWE